LIDNKQIIYLGPLDDEQKSRYLGQSKALLFPIEWEEPFGMVMVEAMACGTPVIAFNRGAVSEIIKEGITGFIADTIPEMNDYVNNVLSIDREKCRSFAHLRFSVETIAAHYLQLV